MRMNLSSAYDLGQKMQNMWIYVYVKFSKRECQQWRMVLCEWCQLWDHSAFVLKQALDWRVEHVPRWGEALPFVANTGMCCWTLKVLNIKTGVEFYYFNGKILIIYFIVLIVNSILIVNLLKSVLNSVFLGWKP